MNPRRGSRAAAVALLGLTLGLLGQAPADLSRPRMAGMAVGSQFGRWSAAANGPISATGGPELATLDSGAFTLPDGTAFLPLAIGTPLLVGGDASPEVVTPTAVNCSVGGASCTLAAVFAHPHPGHFTLASATLGLQEAINAQAANGGGVVLADAGLQGSLASVLPLLHLPGTVLLVDQTRGNWTFYGLGSGAAPQALGGYSSAAGASIGALSGLNGAVFASSQNFIAATPGQSLAAGVPVTVTPSWNPPAGLAPGDSLYVSGGAGTAETVFATNVGVACPGGSSLSVCFTPAQAHTGAWTLASASSGLQEALHLAGAGGWVIDDLPLATLHAPLVLTQTVRLTGFSAMDAGVGSQIVQASPNTDVIQVGTPAAAPSDVVLENLMAVGFSGAGSDVGVAIHCLNCAKLKLENVTAKQAHDGLFLDSANGHAFDASVTNSHFIANFYGVHLVGGSANRDTFVGNTLDGNVYGVFDDGGWVHTWIGNDFEANSQFGYWQQVSNPAGYSGHNVVLQGNYFENNGANAAGQGDAFLGQLVGGGGGNNGAGCINCEVTDNTFNASSGGNVTALNLGAVNGTVSDNTYSGYAAGKTYATSSGPAPNYTHVLSLGDGGGDTGASATSGAFGGSRPGTISRIDPNGGLTLGGWDQLNDIHGSPIQDTTVESPTGNVSLRGKPGGAAAGNPATLDLDGDSTAQQGNSIFWRNAGVNLWQQNNDPFGNGSHDMCLLNDLTNPSAGRCILYVNPQSKMLFSFNGPSGTLATRTQDYQFTQVTNGDSALVVNRATDSSPTGYLLDLEDATLSTPLFRIDATGTVVAGNWNNTGSNLSVGALSASTGSFSGAITAAAGSTVGGSPINTTPARLGAQSGTLFASASFPAGACLTGGVSFASGVALGMAVATNPESPPPAGLVWNPIIDAANHVTVRVCNVTTATIAWSAGAVWDVRVLP